MGYFAPVHWCSRLVSCIACAVSWATWLLFTGAPARCVVLPVRCPGPLGPCSPICPLGVLCCLCGVLSQIAPVHWCARSMRCFACAVARATWPLFPGVPARCVVLRVRCPALLRSCSPVCPLGVLCCVCGVLGHLAPVHRCARSVRCVASAVYWATWLLFTGAPARCVALVVRCSGPLGSFSPVCPLGVLCCVCGVLGHLALVHRCASTVLSFACAVSRATWLLFTIVPGRCVVLRVRCPGPLGSCRPVCSRGGDYSASKGPVNPNQVHQVLAPTVRTTVAVAYTGNIGIMQQPRWSHGSPSTTKQQTGRQSTCVFSRVHHVNIHAACPEW